MDLPWAVLFHTKIYAASDIRNYLDLCAVWRILRSYQNTSAVPSHDEVKNDSIYLFKT